MLPAPAQAPFGEAQVTEDARSWVNAVTFSPKGNLLAFACQDSTVRFKDLTGGPQAPVDLVRWRGLPFLRVTFIDQRLLVACGFDNVPVLFRHNDVRWQVIGSVDAAPAPVPSMSAGSLAARRESSAFDDARNRFKGAASMPKADGAHASSSWHTNTITSCSTLSGMRFSTSALDGQVMIWELTA
eukprot:TRINITY_DN43270_c0_g1_i1.p1 TRINITY_DN43270_c0_g1~~TRINITY_DN43270_c0_g1_i1.p1  ORF type:complete len:185 (+),score=33.96 TRINITY_DN43270_c0_g1_i1:297-851(+)